MNDPFVSWTKIIDRLNTNSVNAFWHAGGQHYGMCYVKVMWSELFWAIPIDIMTFSYQQVLLLMKLSANTALPDGQQLNISTAAVDSFIPSVIENEPWQVYVVLVQIHCQRNGYKNNYGNMTAHKKPIPQSHTEIPGH